MTIGSDRCLLAHPPVQTPSWFLICTCQVNHCSRASVFFTIVYEIDTVSIFHLFSIIYSVPKPIAILFSRDVDDGQTVDMDRLWWQNACKPCGCHSRVMQSITSCLAHQHHPATASAAVTLVSNENRPWICIDWVRVKRRNRINPEAVVAFLQHTSRRADSNNFYLCLFLA